MLNFTLKRLVLLVPQLLLIAFVSFSITRLSPGSQVRAQLGGNASEEAVRAMEEQLGLRDPFFEQFVRSVKNALQGDLGVSWTTGQPVLDDIVQRAPATLELITISFAIILGIALVLGVAGGFSTSRFGWIGDKVSYGYSLMAGAVPDFWFGMILIFVFYYIFPIAVAPIGQFDEALGSVDAVTGFLLVDTLLTGNLAVLVSYLDHLMLPVATLVFINTAPILRMVRSSVADSLESGYIQMGQANGLSQRTVVGYALRSALPPIVTLAGVWYTMLIAGAVLTETIFSWGGVGQYAVQAVQSADWSALQGVVLVAALVSLLVYLAIDLIHAWLDPRTRHV
jgi:peptide/nickel transport system permease protein